MKIKPIVKEIHRKIEEEHGKLVSIEYINELYSVVEYRDFFQNLDLEDKVLVITDVLTYQLTGISPDYYTK